MLDKIRVGKNVTEDSGIGVRHGGGDPSQVPRFLLVTLKSESTA
jgi:hypothetical protein